MATPIQARITLVLLWLVAVLVGVTKCDGEEDWSRCPLECKCKWISGKRTAECQRSGLGGLPEFPKADRIQVLHLNDNPLGQLGDLAFVSSGLINLQKIFMSNCSLDSLHPGAFTGLEILIELDLSGNRLRTLHPGTFDGNIRLRKLWVTSNPLRSLHAFQFPPLPHLRTLDLSQGRLSRLGRQTFAKLEHLELLFLNNNRFRRLDKRTFVPMSDSLKSLTLEGNPWHCDCKLQDFWQWLMLHNLFNSPTACATPTKLKGSSWNKLSFAALACAPVVHVPEPMVAVATGQTATLACLVDETPSAKLQWVRSGVVIKNQSRSVGTAGDKVQSYAIRSGWADPIETNRNVIVTLSGASVSDAADTVSEGGGRWLNDKSTVYRSEDDSVVSSSSSGGSSSGLLMREAASVSRKIWFNLTIFNVQMSGSGGYTCAAKNEGGVSQANVTLVYSESVATYLDDGDISMLMVSGLAAGVLVFLAMATAIVCWVVQRKQRYRLQHQTLRLASTANAGDGSKAANGGGQQEGPVQQTYLQVEGNHYDGGDATSKHDNGSDQWSPSEIGFSMQQPKVIADDVGSGGGGNVRASRNSNAMAPANDKEVEGSGFSLAKEPAPPPHYNGGRDPNGGGGDFAADDSGCDGSATSGNSATPGCNTTNATQQQDHRQINFSAAGAQLFPDIVQQHHHHLSARRAASHNCSPGWTSSSIDSDSTVLPHEHQHQPLMSDWQQQQPMFDRHLQFQQLQSPYSPSVSSARTTDAAAAMDRCLDSDRDLTANAVMFDSQRRPLVGGASVGGASHLQENVYANLYSAAGGGLATMPRQLRRSLEERSGSSHGKAAAAEKRESYFDSLMLSPSINAPFTSSEITSPSRKVAHQIPTGHYDDDEDDDNVLNGAFTTSRPQQPLNNTCSNLPQQMALSRSFNLHGTLPKKQQLHRGDVIRTGSPTGSTGSSMLWSNIVARRMNEIARRDPSKLLLDKGAELMGYAAAAATATSSATAAAATKNNAAAAGGKSSQSQLHKLESIQEVVPSMAAAAAAYTDVVPQAVVTGGGGSCSSFASANPALLAQEMESRKEILHALVKDKNDTPV